MKTFAYKTLVVGASLLFGASVVGRAQTAVYLNDTADTGQSLNFHSGTNTIGNEIFLGAPTYISGFDFEYYSPTNTFSGAVTMTIALLANDGVAVNGHPTPGSVIFSDPSFLLAPPTTALGTGGYADILIETPNIIVPSDFTLAITVSGLSGTDALGLEIYNPITVGGAGDDYWFNNGSGYQLLTAGTGNNNFGARFYTTSVPEPSTIALGLVGGIFLILSFRRRQLSKFA